MASQLANISQMGVESLWHPLTQHQPLRQTPPTHIVGADGCYLTDKDGKQYLDGLAGLWCVNVGYGRAELGAIAAEQMAKLAYLAPTMTHEPVVKLAHKMLEMLDIKGRVYFSASGSEANEAAFKIARQYHLQSGESSVPRYKIISRYRAYHGNTLAAMTANGQAERRIGYDPLAPGFLHVSPPYPYRRHPNFTPEEHALEMVKELEDTIIYEGAGTVAAFIMEPIISGGGVLVPPDVYLPKIREVCDRYGVLLILDEVVAGFGRTGRMFGHQHWGVKPDIVTFAKGLASGYMPIAATVVNQKIFDAFDGDPADLKHFRHVNTYGGHPVATAVAHRNIAIIEEEGLVDNAARVGAYLQGQLETELISHPCVGEVRGKGLLVGVEVVTDKDSKTPLDPAKVGAVIKHCKEQGVLIGRNGNTVPGLANVLITAPPLVLTEADADKIVAALRGGLAALLA